MVKGESVVRGIILECIREGRPTLADFVDCTGRDAADVMAVTGSMQEEGLIRSLSDRGIGSLTYELTRKGEGLLPPLDESGRKLLSGYGLGSADLTILKTVAVKGEMLQDEIARQLKLPNDETISRLTHLVEKGYLLDRGLFRRILRISEKGRKVVTQAS